MTRARAGLGACPGDDGLGPAPGSRVQGQEDGEKPGACRRNVSTTDRAQGAPSGALPRGRSHTGGSCGHSGPREPDASAVQPLPLRAAARPGVQWAVTTGLRPVAVSAVTAVNSCKGCKRWPALCSAPQGPASPHTAPRFPPSLQAPGVGW